MIDLSHGILILDYGSQYTQLIARRVREARVYCEIHPPTVSAAWIRERRPRGIILSGGPSSVYGADAPTADPGLLEALQAAGRASPDSFVGATAREGRLYCRVRLQRGCVRRAGPLAEHSSVVPIVEAARADRV